ncbi:MAG: PP2C family protein-serine/threonine phosphatase [Halocynthiibacter sp.]
MMPEATPNRSVLVVDDSRVQRKILSASLKRWGYRVLEAGSGEEAMEICRNDQVDLILSDWMMPGMSGLEFCKAFREMERESYGYFILLTSKSEKDEVAHGLDMGADDFLTKPVNADELRARLTAGERIHEMERELVEKNRLVSQTLAEMQSLYDKVDRDLIEAKKLQQSLVRERFRDFGTTQISLTLRPSGHVGGDLVGLFPIGNSRIGIYGIDVSGHGISSALMTARLAGYLSGGSPEQNVALESRWDGTYWPRQPAKVAELLNKLVLEEMETEHYFTLLLGYIDLATGRVVMTQAGHPHPVVQLANGAAENIGTGGMPVGLIEDAVFGQFEVTLKSGDRLLIPSDGITECPNRDGGMLDDAGLRALVEKNKSVRGEKFLESLIWDLSKYAGEQDFPDDVSAILIEFSGPEQNSN